MYSKKEAYSSVENSVSLTSQVKSPLQKLARRSSSSIKKEEEKSCICGMHIEGTVWIGCGKCGKWYHIDCVQLTGLSPDHIKMLTSWLCFQCVCSKFALDHDPPTHQRELDGSCVGCPIDGLRGLGIGGRPFPNCRWLFAYDCIQYHSRELID